MEDEMIKVRAENGQTIEVVVSRKKSDAIWIILGEGVHSARCKLTPTRNGLAYAGSVLGREIIYERGVKQVQEDIARENREAFPFKTR
jgi:hypothetical protein